MTDSVNVFPAGMRLTDADTGAPLEGAVVYFYDANTTTPKTVYSDQDLKVVIGTSVTTDSLGYPSSNGAKTLIYVGTDPYKIEIRNSPDEYGNLGALIASHDNVKGAITGTASGTTSINATFNVKNKTGTYSIDTNQDQNNLILANGCTLTLPSASGAGNGWSVTIQNVGSLNSATPVTINTYANSNQTISNGSTSYGTQLLLTVSGQEVTLVSDGSNWIIKNPNLSVLIKPRTVSKTSNYTVVADDYNKIISVNCSSATVAVPITMTLPSASAVFNGWSVTFQHSGSGTIGYTAGSSQTNTNAFNIATVSSQTITYAAKSLGTSVSLYMNGDEITLTSNGANWIASTSVKRQTLMTPITISPSSPQTYINFTGIPYWAKRVTLITKDLTKSTGNTVAVTENDFCIQLGVGTSPTTSGYWNNPVKLLYGNSALVTNNTTSASTAPASGFGIYGDTVKSFWSGKMEFVNLTDNTWVANGMFGTTVYQIDGLAANNSTYDAISLVAGHITLSGSLGMVRVTTDLALGGSLTGGVLNVMYE